MLVPDALEDEDMMEMLNAGLLEAIVVDDWKARMWAQVLPKIKVNERRGGARGRDDRLGDPQEQPEAAGDPQRVLRELHEERRILLEARKKQYFSRIKQLKDPTGSADWKRFEADARAVPASTARSTTSIRSCSRRRATRSRSSTRMRKAAVGAIGVMQLMPATGAELKVGDIKVTETNIHAGAKYMDQLMTRYFPDAKFDELNRTLFAFAAYNAGPGRIAQMRKEAEKRGLDHDQWFNNVEIVTAEKVGIETTTYVRNIYKYYVAYKLMLDVGEVQKKAREQAASGRK